jgi:predicted amidophosphoribosyltransferase
MLCQACHRFHSGHLLCAACRQQLRLASDRLLPGGVRLIAAFEHSGPAKTLIHHFKYRGLAEYADLAASVLAERLPRLPLVPVPRARTRRIRYGIDPARALADRLAHHLGVPVLSLLQPPLHSQRRAGGDHSRVVTEFSLRQAPEGPVLVVDDVVTTGATMLSAITSIGENRVHAAVAANAVPGGTSLRLRSPTRLVTAEVPLTHGISSRS